MLVIIGLLQRTEGRIIMTLRQIWPAVLLRWEALGLDGKAEVPHERAVDDTPLAIATLKAINVSIRVKPVQSRVIAGCLPVERELVGSASACSPSTSHR